MMVPREMPCGWIIALLQVAGVVYSETKSLQAGRGAALPRIIAIFSLSSSFHHEDY
jgi:hypothetical protein